MLLALCALTPRLAAQSASSWSAIGTPAVASRISAIVADPRSGSTLLVATPGGGIWRSEDEAINWGSLSESVPTLRFCSLVRDPASPDILYAGTGDPAEPAQDQGVLHSTDGGRTWSASLPFSDTAVCALAVDPTDSRRIAAASEQGLFLSADSGATWRRMISGTFTAVAFDAQGKLFAGRLGAAELGAAEIGARAGILVVSANGGASFSNIVLPDTAGSASSRTTSLALFARAGDVYLAVAYQPSDGGGATIDVYRSFDSGGTWNVAAAVAPAAPPMSFAADSTGARIFLVGSNALLNSASRGVSWSNITTRKKSHHAIAVAGGSAWLAGDYGLERILVDGGGSPPVVAGPPVAQFTDLTGTSINDLFAAGPTGLFRHDGSNQLWGTLVSADNVSGVAAGSLATAPQRTVVASSASSAYRSATGGSGAVSVPAVPASEAHAPLPPLLADPGNLANIFIGGQQLYRSTDQGETYQSFATIDPDRTRVIIALAAAPSARRFMYAATACVPQLAGAAGCPAVSYLWRSTNSGQTWVQATPVSGWVHQLTVDTRQTATVFAAVGAQPFSSGGGGQLGDIVRSTDNAASWTSLRSNLPHGTFRSIGIDTTAPLVGALPAQALFAGGDKGVYLTFNGGTQWIALNAGLPRTPVAILRQAGTDGIVAGTLGRGAYNARISGLTASLVSSPLELTADVSPGGSATLALALSNVLNSTVNWSAGAIVPSSGNWLNLGGGGGLLDPRASTSLTVRLDAGALTAGTYSAQIQITSGPSGGATVSQLIPVTLRVETTSFTLSPVSPSAQNGAVSTALPALTVALRDESGNPVPGETINFAISGGGTLNRRSAATQADGTASVILTLPATPGSTTVTATYRDQSVQFTAQALQVTRPALQGNSAVSAATFLGAAPMAPGQIISIFGQNLASGQQQATALPLPATLGATRVLLVAASGDIAIPLFYASPLQVNAVLPVNLAPGVYGLTVEVGGVRGNEIQITNTAYAPGIFTLDSSGRGAGIFVKGDGSIVSAANGAARGSVVSFFAVGMGPVNPALNAGDPGRTSEPLNRTTTTPRVFFDNLEGVVSYSGIAPGFAGLYQINVQIPSGLSLASNIPVSLIVGGVASNRVTIPVQ